MAFMASMGARVRRQRMARRCRKRWCAPHRMSIYADKQPPYERRE
jgi:hypothetical protein